MSGCNNSFPGNNGSFPIGNFPNCVFPPLIPPAQDPNGCANNQPFCPPCPPGGGWMPPWGPFPPDGGNGNGGGGGNGNWNMNWQCPPLPPPPNWPPLIPPAQDDNGCANNQPFCPPCPVPIYYPPFPAIPGDFLPPCSPPPFLPPSGDGSSGSTHPGTQGQNFPFIPLACGPNAPFPPCPPWVNGGNNNDANNGSGSGDGNDFEEEPVVIKKRKRRPSSSTYTIIKRVRKIKNPAPGQTPNPGVPQFPVFPIIPGFPMFPGSGGPGSGSNCNGVPMCPSCFNTFNQMAGSSAASQPWPMLAFNDGFNGMMNPDGMATNFNGINFGCNQ